MLYRPVRSTTVLAASQWLHGRAPLKPGKYGGHRGPGCVKHLFVVETNNPYTSKISFCSHGQVATLMACVRVNNASSVPYSTLLKGTLCS
jgi:hypothetical protein